MKYCKLIFGAIVLLFAISADGKSKKFNYKLKYFRLKNTIKINILNAF